MRVNIDNLTYSLNNKIILNNLSLSLKSGEFLIIHGNNGTGKTTFIKCMIKLNQVPDGVIFLDDIDINKIKRFSNIGLVPQRNEFNYEFPITVNEILTCAYIKKKDDYYRSIIERLNLNEILNENINNLSGGQIQRVFIARALLNQPKMLLLDEPTVGVDAINATAFLEILKECKEKGITIILISHDLEYGLDLADYILTLHNQGDYEFKPNTKEDINGSSQL